MKRFFYILLGLAALYYAHHAVERYRIGKDAGPFVSHAVESLAAGWDPAVLKPYADPKLAASAKLPEVFANYRKLGKLHPPASCAMQDYSAYDYAKQAMNYVSVTYACDLQFDNGPATMFVVIYHYRDIAPWRIESLDLQSPYFNGGGKK